MPVLTPAASVPRPLIIAAALAGVLVFSTAGLWAWYGTAVFFEVIRAGWLACF